MLQVFLKLKEPLHFISRHTVNKEYRDIFFNSVKLFILSQIKKAFQVFLKPLVDLQGEVYTTLPKGLLYIYIISLKS